MNAKREEGQNEATALALLLSSIQAEEDPNIEKILQQFFSPSSPKLVAKKWNYNGFKKADHICFQTSSGVWHHGLIVKCDEDIMVYHMPGEKCYLEAVSFEQLFEAYQKPTIYILSYDRQITRDNSQQIAKQMLKKKSEWGAYSKFLNNCEHFVFFCTTGQKYSEQVEKVLQASLEAAIHLLQGVCSKKK